jgi:anti-sigma factor RsiW
MPPGKPGNPGEALHAATVTSPEFREALDAAGGMAPAEADPADDSSWPDTRPPRHRRWPRRLARALGRVDVWILIVSTAGEIIAYLTPVKH